MNPFRIISAVLFMLSLGLSSVMGQANYSPGQTFSSNGQVPQQVATPVPYYRYQATPAVQRQVKTAPAVRSTPIYNMSATPRPAVSKPKHSASGSTSKGTEKKESAVVKSESKPVVKESVKKETPTAESASTSMPESTDKLVFFSRRTGKKQIALTYDDGPNPTFTPKLTEFLKANNVPATFFLCGNMVKEHPDTVKKLAEDGFELANHTYDHPILSKLSREKIQDQLQDTHDLIKEASGVDVKLMRPPYGAKNKTVEDVCETMGYKIIQWDIDTEDWKKKSSSYMIDYIMKHARDGSIILMHDRLHNRKETVLETTREVVAQLRAKGYTFVTVGELIGQTDVGSNALTPAVPSATVEVPIPVVDAETTASLPAPILP